MGDAYLMLGQPAKAVESYSHALSIDPRFGSHNGRAFALAALGRYDEALAQQPDTAPPLTAMLLSRVGRYRDAARQLSSAIAENQARDNRTILGGLHLMSAALAIERRDVTAARRSTAAAQAQYASVAAAPLGAGLG